MEKLAYFKISTLGLGLFFFLFFSHVYAQSSRQECQFEINRMRDIYIVILRKIPAMPPLAKISPGIKRALDDAETSRDAGDYSGCVANMQRQIAIVQGYAR